MEITNTILDYTIFIGSIFCFVALSAFLVWAIRNSYNERREEEKQSRIIISAIGIFTLSAWLYYAINYINKEQNHSVILIFFVSLILTILMANILFFWDSFIRYLFRRKFRKLKQNRTEKAETFLREKCEAYKNDSEEELADRTFSGNFVIELLEEFQTRC